MKKLIASIIIGIEANTPTDHEDIIQ